MRRERQRPIQCLQMFKEPFHLPFVIEQSRVVGEQDRGVNVYKHPGFQGDRMQTLPSKQSLELKGFLCQGQFELLCQTCSLFPGSMKNETLEGGRRSLFCVHDELGTT